MPKLAAALLSDAHGLRRTRIPGAAKARPSRETGMIGATSASMGVGIVTDSVRDSAGDSATRGAPRFEPKVDSFGRNIVPAACLGVFTTIWVGVAIAPRYRLDWLLENLLTLAIVPALVLTHRRFRFSDRAYIQGTILLILHTIGSYYTYSETPIGQWLSAAFGWQRNHYDRVVHLCFGLLIWRPLVELTFARATGISRARRDFVGIAEIAFFSVLYEIIEWITAAIVDPSASAAFLGAQGDMWDAQKDMALACCGAVIAAVLDRWLDAERIKLRPTHGDVGGSPRSDSRIEGSLR